MKNQFSPSNAMPIDVKAYVELLYGGMPPSPEVVKTTLVHTLTTSSQRLQIWAIRVGDPRWLEWHLTLHLPISSAEHNFPILLSSDGCWPHVVNTQAIDAVLEQGVCLAHFDRLQFAHDRPDGQRSGALYEHWPDSHCGAISAWAWGLQTNVQALMQIPALNHRKMGVIGHSRGGKAALLAGATDSHIAMTVTHNSGCAGAASFQISDDTAETLMGLQATFPHWLGLACHDAQVLAELQSIDNWALLECFTGRHLCVLQASDDLWANPQGTRYAVARLKAHWESLELGERLHHFTRTGGHAMSALDWSRAAQSLAQMEKSS
jgi:dienelactone hydrolase